MLWGVISEQEGGLLNINRVTSGRRKEPPCASPQPSLRNEGAAVRWCVPSSEPSMEPATELGSDPNPIMEARSVPSQVTPVPHTPGHSLTVEAQRSW